eukprot:Skav219315  [mRNA]  locus=scaffold1152:152548:152757:- [translate_table: standard]
MALLRDVAVLRQHLQRYLQNIKSSDSRRVHSNSCRSAGELLSFLEAEFDLRKEKARPLITVRQMQECNV